MKKLLKTLIILAILVTGVLTALGFGLRSTIQEQVLNGLSNLSRSPQGKPYAASADQVEFSPLRAKFSSVGWRCVASRPTGRKPGLPLKSPSGCPCACCWPSRPCGS